MKKEIFEQRRHAFMEGRPYPSVTCIFSGRAPMRSEDESYAFSVNRSFYYLTGLERENMVLVFIRQDAGTYEERIFIEPYDEEQAKWVGGRMRAEEVTAVSGIRTVGDRNAFTSWMTHFFVSCRKNPPMQICLDLWRYEDDQAESQALQFAGWIQKNYPAFVIRDIYQDIARMREIKTEEELALMHRAQETTRSAIIFMMQYARPGMNETEIEGAFDFGLMRQGCREHAFPTIAAGGARATTLHYGDNNCVVKDGDLVLVDLGGTEEHYCADISRTFPVSGRFSDRQKELYLTVLEAQRIVREHARPGVTMRELNQLVIDYYETRLDDLGLRKNGKTVRDYYYHSVTHSLGLDTHDVVTSYTKPLAAGMVITDEPGLYVEDEGIGIRIEDDLLITENGCVNLSERIPKTIEEIEEIMQTKLTVCREPASGAGETIGK